MIFEIVRATPEHARAMALHVRQVEVDELRAATGRGVEAVLLSEVAESLTAWTWLVDGRPGCMFGVWAPSLFSVECYPWFVSTALVEVHARKFARTCKELLPELVSRHPSLVGHVDCRHVLSVRWLRWLGAELGNAVPWGVAGSPFHPFAFGPAHGTRY